MRVEARRESVEVREVERLVAVVRRERMRVWLAWWVDTMVGGKRVLVG